jgi:hypothetical protein
MTGSPALCIIGHVSPCNMTREAGPSTLRSEAEVTVTAALCDQWPIASSTSPAPC